MNSWPVSQDDAGWSVDRLVSALAFSDGEARLVERWSVIARVPLDELLLELNLDGDSSDATVEVYGGTLTTDSWPRRRRDRRLIDVLLPHVLEARERHRFTVVARAPLRHPFGRHSP